MRRDYRSWTYKCKVCGRTWTASFLLSSFDDDEYGVCPVDRASSITNERIHAAMSDDKPYTWAWYDKPNHVFTIDDFDEWVRTVREEAGL